MRRLVAFARSDLMADPPPRDVDLILCRYLVFTYYEGARRRPPWSGSSGRYGRPVR